MQRKSKESLSSLVKRLQDLNLVPMADALTELDKSKELYEKSGLEILDNLISAEEISETNDTVQKNKDAAKFYFPQADLQDVIYKPERHINAPLVDQLSTNQYIENSRNIIITSATGCGKTFFACAFGIKACESKYKVAYYTMDELLDILNKAQEKGNYVKKLKLIGNKNLIIIDDFLLTSITQKDAEHLYRLVNHKPYKNRPRSFIICSQLMKDEMYTKLSTVQPSLGDAILNRLSSKAYELEIQGDSMRDMDIPTELQRIKEAKANAGAQ